MILKSFNLKDNIIKKSNLFLFYGENEGQKEEVINNFFLKEFNGEKIKFEEKNILEDKEKFFETCLNDSLFSSEKIIQIARVTSKSYDIIKEISNKKIFNKKIIFISGILEKKSKIRQMFEKEKDLICVPFYKDDNYALFKIASNFFKKNNILISSENLNLIVDVCSGDRKNLENEMNKILNYCFKKNKITREEILKLINLYENENYFELIDACLMKNQKKVSKIINSSVFEKKDSIILIRSLLLRLKRLIELKKLQTEINDISQTINNFKPPIFWKDKEIVHKQMEIWSLKKVYELLDATVNLEINYKKNSNLSNNLVFDLIINTSNN